jgi:hypothetical protein
VVEHSTLQPQVALVVLVAVAVQARIRHERVVRELQTKDLLVVMASYLALFLRVAVEVVQLRLELTLR